MSDVPKPVINEARDKVRLGELTFEYDLNRRTIQIRIGDERVLAVGEGFSSRLWQGFVKDLENKPLSPGPLLWALQRIREMGKQAKRIKSQEERNERGSRALQPGVEPFMQMGIRVESLAQQVLEKYERTSPEEKEDRRHNISMLESGSLPKGIAPEEVTAALNSEAVSMSATVEAINWQLSVIGEHRIVFLLYSYTGGEDKDRVGVRYAVHIDGKACSSRTVVGD